jgi:bifunctional enzyme CysN/CysC
VKTAIRLAVVGHVDHGKSSVIGRLLIDMDALSEDRIAEVAAASAADAPIDPALVTDSLEEERANNITIDTTEVRLADGGREYVIIDTPGHKQFLRNMVTGASRAHAAVLVVDAMQGIRDQTRRHVAVLRTIGVGQVAVAVNKMDLAGFERAVFLERRRELAEILDGFDVVETVPVSARDGDNVARPSERTPWYAGGTLRQAMARFVPEEPATALPLRFPVQGARPGENGALVFGRIESGRITPGDPIVFCPSGICTKVASIVQGANGDIGAVAGQSVGITLADNVLPPPGEVICHRGAPIPSARRIRATVLWLSAPPLREGMHLTVKSASQAVDCEVTCIRKQGSDADPELTGATLSDGEFGSVELEFGWPLAVERFRDVPRLGRLAFSLGGTLVGAGVVDALAGKNTQVKTSLATASVATSVPSSRQR